jgi:F-type H+-transporting ATPase subunit b
MVILEAAKPSLIDINFGLMFWTLVTFVIVLVILKWKAFGPIQAMIDARRKAIASDLEAAEQARTEAQAALAEYRQQLNESRREAARIVEDARRAMDEKRRSDMEELEADKQRSVARARAEIAAETRQSLAAIKDQVAELTLAATEKVLRSKLDEREQRRLIDEALADVDLASLTPAEAGGEQPQEEPS